MLTKEKLSNQLKQLIAIRSLSGNFELNSKVLDLVQTLISEKAVVKRVKNKTAEILLISNSKKYIMNPEFGFMVHVDVVAASNEKLWIMQTEQKECITPQDKQAGKEAISQTVALGRGVSDMKYSVPIGISILNDLIEQNSDRTFTLAITTDEERGGFDGGSYLANEMKFRPQNLIVPDGGDNWNFVYKAKGILHIRITCKGRAAHGSRPWKGKNAISLINKVLYELNSRYEMNNFEPNWNTTMNPGVISGGVSVNQVCDLASLEIDFRYPETTSIEAITKEVEDIAKKVGADIEIETMSSGLATFTDPKLPIVKKFIQAMQNNTQSKIFVEQNFGASDARHFAAFNTPILMMKPMGGDIHENTEWISLDACIEYEKGLFEFITK